MSHDNPLRPWETEPTTDILVHRAFEAFNAGGIHAVLLWCTPDVVFYPIPEWLDHPVEGYEGIRALVGPLEAFDDLTASIHRIRQRGGYEEVLISAKLTGRVRASHAAIRQDFGLICANFEHRRIGKWAFYRTWRETLDAVGWEE